jgi:hypothetical protein
MFRTWFHRSDKRLFHHFPRPQRLQLEPLEDRCLLATLTGVGTPPLFPQPTEGAAFTAQIATIFDDDPTIMPSNFTVAINWGDGTALDTTTGVVTPISGSPAAFSVAGTHTFAEESSSVTPPFGTPLTIKVMDTKNVLSTMITTQIDVVDNNLSQGDPVTATPTPFSGGGMGQPTTATAIANFEAAIKGAKNNGINQPSNGGFRTITWDGVKTDGTDSGGPPNTTVISQGNTVGIPLDRFQPQGVYFGAVYAVTGNGFTTVNPSTAGLFPPFSPPNTFAMFNDNGIDFKFVVPSLATSTIVSASSRGFGAVFINVELANTTSIQFFNGNQVLDTVFAPVGGKGQPVFVGDLFPSAVVTRVVLTLGTDVIFSFDGTTFHPGPNADNPALGHNLVVTDDWIFAEPVPAPNGLPIVTGAQGTQFAQPTVTALPGMAFSGVVATFSDLDPNGNAADFTATINWGNGTLTNGTIKADGKGGFSVLGTNTYGFAGTFPINVDIADFGGGNGINGSIPTVSVNNTAVVGDSNDRFLFQVFQDVLRRPIDAVGQIFFKELLTAGVSRSQVLAMILNSPEFKTDEVNILYQHYLLRAADPAGLAFFTPFLETGGTLEQAAAILANSPEFLQKNGGTQTSALMAFFQLATGQPIDQTNLNNFTAQLAAGANLAQIATQIFALPVYANHIVDVFFQDFVRRHADATGLAFFTPIINQGTVGGLEPDARVISLLLSSPEYDGLVQANPLLLPLVPVDPLKSSLP